MEYRPASVMRLLQRSSCVPGSGILRAAQSMFHSQFWYYSVRSSAYGELRFSSCTVFLHAQYDSHHAGDYTENFTKDLHYHLQIFLLVKGFERSGKHHVICSHGYVARIS